MQETDHDHLWVNDGDRIVCTHCGMNIKEDQWPKRRSKSLSKSSCVA